MRLFLTVAFCLTMALPAFAKKNRKQPGIVVPWRTLPAPIQAGLQSNTSGGKVKEVQKITAANGVIFYCAEVKGGDGKWVKVYVNDAGVLLRTEPDNARNKRKHKPLFGD